MDLDECVITFFLTIATPPLNIDVVAGQLAHWLSDANNSFLVPAKTVSTFLQSVVRVMTGVKVRQNSEGQLEIRILSNDATRREQRRVASQLEQQLRQFAAPAHIVNEVLRQRVETELSGGDGVHRDVMMVVVQQLLLALYREMDYSRLHYFLTQLLQTPYLDTFLMATQELEYEEYEAFGGSADLLGYVEERALDEGDLSMLSGSVVKEWEEEEWKESGKEEDPLSAVDSSSDSDEASDLSYDSTEDELMGKLLNNIPNKISVKMPAEEPHDGTPPELPVETPIQTQDKTPAETPTETFPGAPSEVPTDPPAAVSEPVPVGTPVETPEITPAKIPEELPASPSEEPHSNLPEELHTTDPGEPHTNPEEPHPNPEEANTNPGEPNTNPEEPHTNPEEANTDPTKPLNSTPEEIPAKSQSTTPALPSSETPGETIDEPFDETPDETPPEGSEHVDIFSPDSNLGVFLRVGSLRGAEA